MRVEIRAAASPGEVRVAALADGVLRDYAIWRPGAPDGVGDLYRGRVTARVPAMAGVFVALDGAEGFLPDSDGGAGRGVGDGVGVRVVRAPTGTKGPRLTAKLADAERSLIGADTRGLVRRGPNPVLRFAVRYPEAAVLVDQAALAVTLRPALAGRLALVATSLDATQLAEIAALGEPTVSLASGASLSIHPTPALVAIDVDSGSATSGRVGKRAAQLAVNAALLPELARQIRLRELGGAILVDFAGLSPRDRAALGPLLAAALAEDPAGPRLLGFTGLGLAEIVRPRIHPPLHEVLAGPHAAGLEALRRIADEIAADPRSGRALRAAPDVVAALQADRFALPDLAHRAGRPLILRSDPALASSAWLIEAPHD